MFSEMVAELNRGREPEPGPLRKRFDFALIKKTAAVRLPPSFRTGDPKINPRSDHLFWAALLLMDRERIDLALAVMAAEAAEKNGSAGAWRPAAEMHVRTLITSFFRQIPDRTVRRRLRRELGRVIPEWIGEHGGEKA